MKTNHKVLLSVILAGLFAVPAFAKKGPAKMGPATEKVCKDEAGYTIPCDNDDSKGENKATASAQKADTPTTAPAAETPKK